MFCKMAMLSNCLPNISVNRPRLVLPSALARETSFFAGQQSMQRLVTDQSVKRVECLALNGTAVATLPQVQRPPWMRKQKGCKSWKMGPCTSCAVGAWSSGLGTEVDTNVPQLWLPAQDPYRHKPERSVNITASGARQT